MKYFLDFKLTVLHYKQETEASYRENAKKFGLNNPSLIANWQRAYLEGEANQLKNLIGRPSNMHKKSELSKKSKKMNLSQKEELEHLRQEVNYLKYRKLIPKKAKGIGSERPSRSQQTQFAIEILEKGFQLKDILTVLELPESSYHYHKNRLDQSNPDETLGKEILIIFKDSKETYGYQRITVELKKCLNEKINHKKVQRLMKKLGLKCTKFWRKSRRYNSYKGKVGKTAPNCLKCRINAKYPLQKIVTDVTEINTIDGKKLYLSPKMDLFNSEIIAWNISARPTLDFVIKPLKETIRMIERDAVYRTTIHSDQSWQYQHRQWVNMLKENRIFQSMSRKGNCLDNSPIENFFRILKQEMYYGEPLMTYEQLKHKINKYIHQYNNQRIKEKLNGMSPVEYRKHTAQLAA